MGFLSGILGFKNRALVTIAFYDENNRAAVSVVEYRGSSGVLAEDDWSWVVLLYVAKTLHTLGDPDAPILIEQLGTYAAAVLEKPMSHYLLGNEVPSALKGEVELIPPRAGIACLSIDILQKPGQLVTIQTRIESGAMQGQIALSAWVMVDFMLGRLSNPARRYLFCVQLAFLAKYYREGGSYRSMNSVTEAPVFVLSCMARMGQA